MNEIYQNRIKYYIVTAGKHFPDTFKTGLKIGIVALFLYQLKPIPIFNQLYHNSITIFLESLKDVYYAFVLLLVSMGIVTVLISVPTNKNAWCKKVLQFIQPKFEHSFYTTSFLAMGFSVATFMNIFLSRNPSSITIFFGILWMAVLFLFVPVIQIKAILLLGNINVSNQRLHRRPG